MNFTYEETSLIMQCLRSDARRLYAGAEDCKDKESAQYLREEADKRIALADDVLLKALEA